MMRRAREACTAAVLALAAALQAAQAGDRPFLATTSAAAEEDDDGVWSVESVFERRGRERALAVAAEYAFDPTMSVQVEVGAQRERGGARGQEAEFEVKHLFNHIARDGYGWGLSLGLGLERDGGGAWRRGTAGATMPFTLALPDHVGAVHFNAGVDKPRGERRLWRLAAGIEHEVGRRATLVAEAAREGSSRLLHAGLRWWVRRERVAVDVSALRERSGGEARSGFVFGLGFYDL